MQRYVKFRELRASKASKSVTFGYETPSLIFEFALIDSFPVSDHMFRGLGIKPRT